MDRLRVANSTENVQAANTAKAKAGSKNKKPVSVS